MAKSTKKTAPKKAVKQAVKKAASPKKAVAKKAVKSAKAAAKKSAPKKAVKQAAKKAAPKKAVAKTAVKSAKAATKKIAPKKAVKQAPKKVASPKKVVAKTAVKSAKAVAKKLAPKKAVKQAPKKAASPKKAVKQAPKKAASPKKAVKQATKKAVAKKTNTTSNQSLIKKDSPLKEAAINVAAKLINFGKHLTHSGDNNDNKKISVPAPKKAGNRKSGKDDSYINNPKLANNQVADTDGDINADAQKPMTNNITNTGKNNMNSDYAGDKTRTNLNNEPEMEEPVDAPVTEEPGNIRGGDNETPLM